MQPTSATWRNLRMSLPAIALVATLALAAAPAEALCGCSVAAAVVSWEPCWSVYVDGFYVGDWCGGNIAPYTGLPSPTVFVEAGEGGVTAYSAELGAHIHEPLPKSPLA